MMQNLDTQTIIDTNDEGLRRLIRERLKVFAKFTSTGCVTCELLAPSFAGHAQAEEATGILFLRLDSEQNAVARKIMNDKAAPFFVSYCQGRILECDSLTQEAEVTDMLQRLRAFKPLHA